MQLNYLSSLLLFLSLLGINLVRGQGVALDNYEEQEEPAPVEKPFPSINLDITYNIEDREAPATPTDPVSFDQNEVVMLNYTLVNNEDCDISVMGVSGEILSYPSGEAVTKISFGEMEDLYAKPNETLQFRQKVLINLEPGMYYLFPMIHITNETAVSITKDDPALAEIEDVDTTPKNVAAKPTVLNIEDPLMSIFNPQFLSVQFIILATVGGLSYFYLNKNGKLNNKKNNLQTSKNIGKRDPTEWLPEQYKK